MSEESTVARVQKGEGLTWKKMRDLALAVNNLYEEKKVEGNRVTDANANKFARTEFGHSSEGIGFVNLAEDITAPFKAADLGKPLGSTGEGTGEGEVFYQRFDFGYKDDCKKYLNRREYPVLYSQYLVKKYGNDFSTHFSSQDLADIIGSDTLNTNWLLECKMGTIRKFWSTDTSPQPTTENTYPNGVSSELYASIDNFIGGVDGGKCGALMRFAFAGKWCKGNGNSVIRCTNGALEQRPFWQDIDDPNSTDFLNSAVNNGSEPEFPQNNSKAFALTLTGVAWKNNLGPETSDENGLASPAMGCCTDVVWPLIGADGGEDPSWRTMEEPVTTGMYNVANLTSTLIDPTGELVTVLDDCDWRRRYQGKLTQSQIEASRWLSPNETKKPKYAARAYSAIEPEDVRLYKDDWTPRFDGDSDPRFWIKLEDATTLKAYPDGVWLRIAPIKFKFDNTHYRCVWGAISLVVGVRVKAIQPAIRKRWFEMIYYTLRNIAGYKYKDGAVVGVTWKKEFYDDLCSFVEGDSLTLECAANRWKAMGIGNLTELNDDGTPKELKNPFVGPSSLYDSMSQKALDTRDGEYDAAQMWQAPWATDEEAPKITQETHFFEPYFERFICAINSDKNEKYSEKFISPSEKGGFDTHTTYKEGAAGCEVYHCTDLILPWNGGDNSEEGDCNESSAIFTWKTDTVTPVKETEEKQYRVYAHTFNNLCKLYDYIKTYKEPENKTLARQGGTIACVCEATSNWWYPETSSCNWQYNFPIDAGCALTIQGRESMHGDMTSPYSDCEKTNDTVHFTPYYYLTPPETDTYANTDGIDEPGLLREVDMEGDSASFVKYECDHYYGRNMYIWKEFDPYSSTTSQNITISILDEAGTAGSPDKVIGGVPAQSTGVVSTLESEEYDHYYPADRGNRETNGALTVAHLFLAPTYKQNTDGTPGAEYIGRIVAYPNFNTVDFEYDGFYCYEPGGAVIPESYAKYTTYMLEYETPEFIGDKKYADKIKIYTNPSQENKNTLQYTAEISKSIFDDVKDNRKKYIIIASRSSRFRLRSCLKSRGAIIYAKPPSDDIEADPDWLVYWGLKTAPCGVHTDAFALPCGSGGITPWEFGSQIQTNITISDGTSST